MASDTLTSVAPVHRFILLTDIAQSSRLAEQYGPAYVSALEEHNGLVEAAVAECAGKVYKQTGDGYLALFETADTCLAAALELGEALGQLRPLAEDDPLLVRLALHAGSLQPSGDEYFSPALNRVSRICQVCNPGQVLASGAVAGYFGGAGGTAREAQAGTAALPAGFKLLDLGRHHLRDLAEPEQLFQLDSERFSRRKFPPLSTLDNRPNNLVSQPNHFIGREKELKALASLLQADTRLLSITAPGGYGKSRLAAQLCGNLLHRYENGVFMVYLAPVRESIDVPTAIAIALGYQFSAGRTPEQQLRDYLQAKDLLLCLDNFEHLLKCTPLVAELLKAAPKLNVVITSREPLRLQGEHIYRLEPLPVEAEGEERYSEAQQLFTDRAALVSSGIALMADNAEQVQQICRQLSGIPLAIELAAAWMDGFTLSELSAELSRQLELEARASDRPQRHQSLKACLDWSWNLLGEEQQTILMKLSTFRGGFFSEAAAAVLGLTGMTLRTALLKLSDKSWLYAREVDGQTRFFLRDMLAHEYAFARLAGTRGAEDSLFEQAVQAHAEYFVGLVEREGPRLNGGGTPDGGALQMAAVRSWRLELDNILEALDSGVRRGAISWLLPIARHLQVYLEQVSSFYTQRDRYSLLLETASAGSHAELLIQAQLGQGRALWRLGDYSSAQELFEQALALSRRRDDRRGQASSLNNLGIVADLQGNCSAAQEMYEQARVLFRELGNRKGEASCLNNLGVVKDLQGNYGAAQELLAQSLALCREVGNRKSEASCLINLGVIQYTQGSYGPARELLEQALALCREMGDRNGEALSLSKLADVEYLQGNYGAARDLLEQSLTLCRELGARLSKAGCLESLGGVEFMQTNLGAARELYEQALVLYREMGYLRGEAFSLNSLGIVEYMQGNYSVAQALHGQALALFLDLGLKSGIADTCICAGTTAAALGRPRTATRAIYGGQSGAVGLEYKLDKLKQQVLEAGLARLNAAVADGAITAAQLSRWQAEGEAMSLDELAELTLAELAQLADAPATAVTPVQG